MHAVLFTGHLLALNCNRANSSYSNCFCSHGVKTNFTKQMKSPSIVQAIPCLSEQTRTKLYTLFWTERTKTIPYLSSATSPYRPYKGVHPPFLLSL